VARGVTGCLESRVVSAEELRRAMGHFATGVTVVTSRDRTGSPVGTTANAITSLSLEPPLLLVCLDRASLTLRALREHGTFAVNVLGHHQRRLSAAFARRGSDGWRGVRQELCATGTPRVADALATLDCRVERLYPGGDHRIVVGRVVEAVLGESGEPPLVFHRGAYATVERLP
jgi:3-hydroxy-9,10-secoandrosta-1,3,5(10)-triene-9,17-dione monooxygenase reductase component